METNINESYTLAKNIYATNKMAYLAMPISISTSISTLNSIRLNNYKNQDQKSFDALIKHTIPRKTTMYNMRGGGGGNNKGCGYADDDDTGTCGGKSYE
jgi:hypothetical protein